LEEEVGRGLSFLLRHFVGQDQAIWAPSRGTLVAGDGLPVYRKVHSVEECLELFKDHGFKDCMINGYPCRSKYRIRYPSLLFFDVDDGRNLGIILERIKRLLGGHPTVLETSPGHFHILQPVNARSSALTDLFMDDLAEFPRFAEQYIGDGVLTDPGHYPAFDSFMLRVPFSINTKHEQDFQVRIVQEWDGRLASVKALELPFAAYLARRTISCKRRWRKGKGRACRGYKWIENILQKGIKNGRNILIWKVFAPGMINVLKLSEDEAIDRIMDWIDMCKVIRRTKITKNMVKDYV
jgi:hypothetical protein